MKRPPCAIVGAILFTFGLYLSISTQAGTIYVTTAGNDANTGLSWSQAMQTVAAGLNAAAPGDQVWVAAGTYNERITLKLGVGLYGGFAGTDNETDLSQRNWTANVTILNARQEGRVVTSPPGADNTTRIDGFTIRNGNPRVLFGRCYCGGGICCISSSPTIANNTISGNQGFDVWRDLLRDSFPTIISNTICGNYGNHGGGGIIAGGALAGHYQ